MPILNRAPGGPLAEISPSNSYPGLTRHVSLPATWGGYRNEPNTFYPTGVRHYVRLAANDDFEGVADAILAKRLGLRSAYLLDDGQGAQDVWITNPFRRTARRLDIRIAGAERFDPAANSYDALAAKIARSGAQGVVIGGDVFEGGDRLLKALRARLGPRTAIMTGELGFTPVSEVLKRAGRAARGLYVSSVNIPGAARDVSPAARSSYAISAPRRPCHGCSRPVRRPSSCFRRSRVRTGRARQCSKSYGRLTSRTASSAASASIATGTSRRPR